MTYILLLMVTIYFISSKPLIVYTLYTNQKSVKNLNCSITPAANVSYYIINLTHKAKVISCNQNFELHVLELNEQVVCVKIQLMKEGQTVVKSLLISANNHTAIAKFRPDFIDSSEQFTITIRLLMEKQGGYYWSQVFKYENNAIPECVSFHCKNEKEFLAISLSHLDKRTAKYNVSVTLKNDPLLITWCEQTFHMHHQTKKAQVFFNYSCFQECKRTYRVMVKPLQLNKPYLATFLRIPCNWNTSSELQAKQNLCGDFEQETTLAPVSFISTTSQPYFSTTHIQPLKGSSQGSAIWILILVLILSLIICLFMILQRRKCLKYLQCTNINQDTAQQQGLVICFPYPMEHCAAVKELTIMLNSYTSLHVRSSHKMKLKRNKLLKKQIQHVYDYFNTFIIVHSDGLYYHYQNEEKNGIGQEMADFTIELVKFCTKDNMNKLKNIFHVTFEDLSNFENSQLCSDSQENIYYLYRPNVLGNNNSLDLNQIENLLCDINDQQSEIQPSRHHVKFQMNWKESREIQNLNDALVSRDYKQRMFPNWYTDMFPKFEINETLSNFSFDKNSKISDSMSFEVYKNNTFINSRLNGGDSISYTVSETGNDQISVLLERINERNNRNVQSTLEC
eukprot:XP_014769260.1 PREDICTED: uncharacterized protein LOC106868483 isoform X1 [Octopus bimaculoides]